MKTKKIAAAVFVATTGLALAQPMAASATSDNGTSEASVTVNQEIVDPEPSGSVSFMDVTKNAKIIFADTTLTGGEQTSIEQTAGSAKIIISDTRQNLGTGQAGEYTVSVKDVTADADTNSFLKNNLALNLASADVAGKGQHQHSKLTVSASDQTVFSGKYETGVIEKEVTLNPTLTIPSALTLSGDFQASLQWTLTPEV